MIRFWITLFVIGILGPQIGAEALAAGKKKPETPLSLAQNGKRVIALENVRDVRIELPNHEVKDFGQGFQAKLTSRLTESGRYIVADPEAEHAAAIAESERGPEYHWSGKFVPAAKIRVVVDAMNFVTGGRGGRMFYGFDERMRTVFNDGFGTEKNEFPMRSVLFEPNWMDRTFDEKGGELFGSRAGLDLGDGFNIDFLFAFLKLKYASYRSEIHLRVFIDAPLANRNEYRDVRVKGSGYYYDVAGGYLQYSGGITIARTDAMLQAMGRALEATLGVFDRALGDLPLTACLDAVLNDGTLLLGTGFRAEVKPGTLFELADDSSHVVEVTSSVDDGSVAKLVRGDISTLRVGAKLRQVYDLSASPIAELKKAAALSEKVAPGIELPVLVASEAIELKGINISKPDLHGTVPEMSFFQAFLKSLEGLVFLPFRIWRYYSYDQTLNQVADGLGGFLTDAKSWSEAARLAPWAKQMGLDQSPKMAEIHPLVAILDTGVDYNHPVLSEHIWLNPTPWEDPSGRKDRYGWDFISGDSRPYDDGYHGTQLASAVLAVAPEAKIIPIKIFNPWGLTTSAAIYSAFKFATDHNAKLILVGWATRVSSQAIELGVKYAQDHGVIVIAAAGDRGDQLTEIPAYPAVLSKKYSNVITVTGVDPADQLVKVQGKFANFGSEVVGIAAPGKDIRVAEPRLGMAQESSTGIAAALVAGALARKAAIVPDQAPQQWLAELLEQALEVPGLESFVAHGRRLRIQE